MDMIEDTKGGFFMLGSYIVSGGMMIGGMFFKVEHFGLGLGLLLGIATFFMNWYYKHKEYNLKKSSNKHKKIGLIE